MKRLKILTLGWEFPPLYAGGLGPACYGLTKALSEHADITIVLPRSDEDFKMKNVEIIGLNHWLQNQLHRTSRKMEVPTVRPRKSDPMPRKAAVKKTTMESDPMSRKTMDEIEQEEFHHQSRKAEMEQQQRFFEEQDFGVYPLAMPRKAYRRISFPGEADFTVMEKKFTTEESADLFNEADIYGSNIMEKVAAYADAVKEATEGRNFDIIHAHDWVTYPAAIQLKYETRKPLVVHVHSLETDRVHTQSRNAVYGIERMGMWHADSILPVSNFSKSNIVQHYAISEKKINTVYNGIDAERRSHIRRRKKEKRILFLGRITAQKGPEYFFETARKLLRKMPEVKFYVAGNGDQRARLEWLISSNHLSKSFVFTGFIPRESVKNLLATCDAYIMPSVSEPFGLSALEAAQYNLPCIISKQSGAAEVMPNALKADFWDTEKMANYLYAALKYRHLRETLTEKTQDNLKQVNWEIAAIKVMKTYHHLLN